MNWVVSSVTLLAIVYSVGWIGKIREYPNAQAEWAAKKAAQQAQSQTSQETRAASHSSPPTTTTTPPPQTTTTTPATHATTRSQPSTASGTQSARKAPPANNGTPNTTTTPPIAETSTPGTTTSARSLQEHTQETPKSDGVTTATPSTTTTSTTMITTAPASTALAPDASRTALTTDPATPGVTESSTRLDNASDSTNDMPADPLQGQAQPGGLFSRLRFWGKSPDDPNNTSQAPAPASGGGLFGWARRSGSSSPGQQDNRDYPPMGQSVTPGHSPTGQNLNAGQPPAMHRSSHTSSLVMSLGGRSPNQPMAVNNGTQAAVAGALAEEMQVHNMTKTVAGMSMGAMEKELEKIVDKDIRVEQKEVACKMSRQPYMGPYSYYQPTKGPRQALLQPISPTHYR